MLHKLECDLCGRTLDVEGDTANVLLLNAIALGWGGVMETVSREEFVLCPPCMAHVALRGTGELLKC